MSDTGDFWKSVLNELHQSSNFKVLKNQSSKNLKFMKKLGFADDFISAAKIQRGFQFKDLRIDWMYSWLERQNRFFELRPRMLPIGDDGCGNYIYIYDVSKSDSPIVYICHDPAVIMIIAESMSVFLNKLLITISNSSEQQDFFSIFMDDNRLSDAAMKIWNKGIFNGQPNDLGLRYKRISDEEVHVDFSNAKTKAGISLAYLGVRSEIYYTKLENVIVIEKRETDGIQKLHRKDRIAWIYLAVFVFLSYYFLGLFGLSVARRVAVILGTILLLPWSIHLIRYVRKSGPRL